MIDKAILEGKTVVIEPDLLKWAEWFENNRQKRHVADVTIDGVRISTVFLGIDHDFGGGRPLWFETMIFGGPHDQYQNRYTTWAEAESGHAAAVELAKT